MSKRKITLDSVSGWKKMGGCGSSTSLVLWLHVEVSISKILSPKAPLMSRSSSAISV